MLKTPPSSRNVAKAQNSYRDSTLSLLCGIVIAYYIRTLRQRESKKKYKLLRL